MKASTQSSRSFFVWVRLILIINFSLATAKVFVHLLGKVPPSRGLTHMRSMCVNSHDDPILSRGINTYAKHVCWRRRDRGRTLFAREET